jgi:hypothetical protein
MLRELVSGPGIHEKFRMTVRSKKNSRQVLSHSKNNQAENKRGASPSQEKSSFSLIPFLLSVIPAKAGIQGRFSNA